MRRFWQQVRLVPHGADLAVQLDGKPVRTPGGLALAVPHPRLAEAIANEWRAVTGIIDPQAMPLTGLANAAIERIAPAPAPFADALAAYADSDLLCYRADDPPILVARQQAAWDPLLDWARARLGVDFAVTSGIMPHSQPPETLARIAQAIAARTPFELAGLAPIVSISGSLVAALALIEGAATADAIWAAVRIDDDWQTEKWGADTLAMATSAAHERDFRAAAHFLSLLDGAIIRLNDGA